MLNPECSSKILLIRLGALGDLVLCMRAFASIRAHYPHADIALLTAPAFRGFTSLMPWFDSVLVDERPKLTDIRKWATLISSIKNFAPDFVYDFQGKLRQSLLYGCLGGPLWGPSWSGAAPLCSHPRLWPPQKGMHYTDFLHAQLDRAGVPLVDQYDLSWLDEPCPHLTLPDRFALLIPGCAPSRPYKRWPPEAYAELSQRLLAADITPMAIGTNADAQSIRAIQSLTPKVIDLSNQTTLPQLGYLARRAEIVIGNDTGPTHLAASVGATTVALMSDHVDPHWSAPQGAKTTWVQGSPLSSLSVEDVEKAIYSVR